MTRILARDIHAYVADPADILVNACCPGWCKTDMAGYERPPKTADEGANTPVYLALLPPNADVHGQFISDQNRSAFHN